MSERKSSSLNQGMRDFSVPLLRLEDDESQPDSLIEDIANMYRPMSASDSSVSNCPSPPQSQIKQTNQFINNQTIIASAVRIRHVPVWNQPYPYFEPLSDNSDHENTNMSMDLSQDDIDLINRRTPSPVLDKMLQNISSSESLLDSSLKEENKSSEIPCIDLSDDSSDSEIEADVEIIQIETQALPQAHTSQMHVPLRPLSPEASTSTAAITSYFQTPPGSQKNVAIVKPNIRVNAKVDATHLSRVISKINCKLTAAKCKSQASSSNNSSPSAIVADCERPRQEINAPRESVPPIDESEIASSSKQQGVFKIPLSVAKEKQQSSPTTKSTSDSPQSHINSPIGQRPSSSKGLNFSSEQLNKLEKIKQKHANKGSPAFTEPKHLMPRNRVKKFQPRLGGRIRDLAKEDSSTDEDHMKAQRPKPTPMEFNARPGFGSKTSSSMTSPMINTCHKTLLHQSTTDRVSSSDPTKTTRNISQEVSLAELSKSMDEVPRKSKPKINEILTKSPSALNRGERRVLKRYVADNPGTVNVERHPVSDLQMLEYKLKEIEQQKREIEQILEEEYKKKNETDRESRRQRKKKRVVDFASSSSESEDERQLSTSSKMKRVIVSSDEDDDNTLSDYKCITISSSEIEEKSLASRVLDPIVEPKNFDNRAPVEDEEPAARNAAQEIMPPHPPMHPSPPHPPEEESRQNYATPFVPLSAPLEAPSASLPSDVLNEKRFFKSKSSNRKAAQPSKDVSKELPIVTEQHVQHANSPHIQHANSPAVVKPAAKCGLMGERKELDRAFIDRINARTKNIKTAKMVERAHVIRARKKGGIEKIKQIQAVQIRQAHVQNKDMKSAKDKCLTKAWKAAKIIPGKINEVDPQALMSSSKSAAESEDMADHTVLSQILGPADAPEQDKSPVPNLLPSLPWSNFESPLTKIIGKPKMCPPKPTSTATKLQLSGTSSTSVLTTSNPLKRRHGDDANPSCKLKRPKTNMAMGSASKAPRLYSPKLGSNVVPKSCLKPPTDMNNQNGNEGVVRCAKRVSFPEEEVTSRWCPVVEDLGDADIGGKHTALPPETLRLREIIDSDILRWNPQWLYEYSNARSVSLPEICSDMRILETKAPSKFKDYDEYVHRFRQLVIMEIWENVYNDAQSEKARVKTKFGILTGRDPNGDKPFRKIRIGRPAHKNDFLNLSEDDLLIIEFESCGKMIQLFALVENSQDKSKLNQQCPTYMKRMADKLPLEEMNNYRTEQYDLNIKNKAHLNPKFGTVTEVKVQVLSKLCSSLRFVIGVAELKDSPLLPLILSPNSSAHNIQSFMGDALLAQHAMLNESQEEVVRSLSRDIVQNRSEPKIALIHGPPGSGKSRTILALLQEIHVRRQLSRPSEDISKGPILVCAPSNGAVDELARNIIKYNETFPKNHEKRLNFVRVGSDQIAPDVVRYSLDNLAKDNANNEHNIKRHQKEIAKMRHNYLRLVCADGITPKPGLQHAANVARGEIENMQESYDNKCTMKEMRKDLLEGATVIGVTLNSCGIRILDSLPKPCCVIIDEACQSTEMETMIPLQFGSNKLILVGDPQQLPPTVKSKTAASLHLGESLFERCRVCLKNEGKEDVVKFLDTQYRMVKDIAQFPSTHVYNNKLITPSDLLPIPDITPYLLFNVQGNETVQGLGSVMNANEAKLVVEMCKTLLNISKFAPQEIGIITFYKAQVKAIEQKLKGAGDLVEQVEVGTVDGFQGREKAIIILSCVRSNANKTLGFLHDRRRMNVAITRAKFGMYILGNSNTLKKDRDWRALVHDANDRRCVVDVETINEYTLKRFMAQIVNK